MLQFTPVPLKAGGCINVYSYGNLVGERSGQQDCPCPIPQPGLSATREGRDPRPLPGNILPASVCVILRRIISQ